MRLERAFHEVTRNLKSEFKSHRPDHLFLRFSHSFISYRVADIQDVNRVALECGNSPAVIFKHYRELVRPAEAKRWFKVEPDANGKVMVFPKTEGMTVAVA